jgi:5-methylcytosine-specific restriction endonuclease McrA
MKKSDQTKYKHHKAVCLNCYKVFFCYDADIKRGKAKYCSRKCAVLGQQINLEIKCDGCGKTFTRKPGKINKIGKNYCTHVCALKHIDIGNKTKGEKNRLWRGGTGIKGRSYTKEDFRWRRKIRKIFEKKCSFCGSTERLEVDHLWPYSIWPNLRTDIRNGRILCHECHKKTFTYSWRNRNFLLRAKNTFGDNVINFPSSDEIIRVREEIRQKEGI